MPQPIYTADNIRPPAYRLYYTWTGWPSAEGFPERPVESFFKALDACWADDGIRRLETDWRSNEIQLVSSVTPAVSPAFFTGRIKGRLQHALREAGCPTKFSRKVGFRTVGENTTRDVAQYVRNQVANERFIDPRFAAMMQAFTRIDDEVDLSKPTNTASGRYWYNLHLVLVVAERGRIHDPKTLETLSRQCDAVAKKYRQWISVGSLLPDHLHVALRGDIERSPAEIALSYMNNLAYAVGQKAIWQPSFYVGTFSEYDMGAIRAKQR